MMTILIRISLCIVLLLSMHGNQIHSLKGTWELLMKDAGTASMHTALTHYGTLILLDRRTSSDLDQSSLSHRRCFHGESNSIDCIVQSAEYNPRSNTIRPLSVLTDTWCSSGQFDPNGTLVQTGGFGAGSRRIRYFNPCGTGGQCHWIESKEVELRDTRWYATNQILPDGRQIVVGGRGAFNFEFVPPKSPRDQPTFLSLLSNRRKYMTDDSFYPFLHLLPDGTLFIMAGVDSILLDLHTNRIVKSFPEIPDVPRTYPAGGSSVMLPLMAIDGFRQVTVVVCGGSNLGAFWKRHSYKYAASTSCGRINVTDRNPRWEMEEMPIRRTMGDMLILPTREVLIINGAQDGCQGYGKASNPALNPILYKPDSTVGKRFELQTPTNVARMYHSTANLLPDGRILVAGSNAHETYIFSGPFPSELRLEAFSPDYMSSIHDRFRVKIDRADHRVQYGREFSVEVSITDGLILKHGLEVNLINAPFATHSFSQGQRLVGVRTASVELYKQNIKTLVKIKCEAPPKAEIAPPGYYMVFVVNNGIPTASAHWILISNY